MGGSGICCPVIHYPTVADKKRPRLVRLRQRRPGFYRADYSTIYRTAIALSQNRLLRPLPSVCHCLPTHPQCVRRSSLVLVPCDVPHPYTKRQPYKSQV